MSGALFKIVHFRHNIAKKEKEGVKSGYRLNIINILADSQI
jgi:hypothetical protein